MFLIPEELFVELNASKTSGRSNGSATGLIRERLSQIESDKNLDADAKEIQYQQEFKRYNKLLREAEDRPTDVRLQNFEEIAEKVANYSKPGASTPVAKNIQPKKIQRPLQKSKRIGKKRPSKISSNKIDSDEESFHSMNEVPASSSASLSNEAIKTKAMAYIRKNAKEFGSDGDKLLKWVGNQWSAIPGSSIENIIDHILKYGGQRTRPLRVGHEEFIKRLDSHPRLKEILLPNKTLQQSGRGLGRMRSNKKKGINAKSTPFYFKPSLWPRT